VSDVEAGDRADQPGDPNDGAVRPAAAAPRSPAVATALQELGRLSDLDLGEHPEVYQQIHAELQGALTSIDDA
jgi:hypothetical protein